MSLWPVILYQAARGALDNYSNQKMIGMQKDAQSELQAEQNAFQSAENEKDRAWQEKTWLEHFLAENEEYANRLGLQFQNWKSQFDIENAYNNPSAQMQRLLAAGINPSAMLQNSGLASLGESSAQPYGGSAAEPSGDAFSSHAVAPASAPSFGGLSSQAANFSSIAQMADSISKLQQVGLNAGRQAAILPVEVERAVNEAELARQKALLVEIEKNVSSAWLDKKAGAEFNKLVADSYAAYTQGDLNKANELVSQANERLVSLEGEIKAEQRPQLLANLKELQNVYRTEEQKNRAQSQQALASARQAESQVSLNEAITETENELRGGKVTAQVLSNGFQRIVNQIERRENVNQIRTNEWRIWQIIQEAKRAGYVTSEQLEKWKIASKDNDSYEMRLVLESILHSLPTSSVSF